MTFINLAAGLDVWAVSSLLYRYRDELKAVPVAEIPLYANNVMSARLDKWGSMRTLLAKCRRMAEGTQHDMISASIEMLQPGEVTIWRKNPNELIYVEVGLVTNPGALLFHGNQAMHLPVGNAVAYGSKIWSSAINVGDRGRIHLVLELEKRREET